VVHPVDAGFFLKSAISRSQGKLLLSDGNDHLYRDPDYSWDEYIYPEGHKQSYRIASPCFSMPKISLLQNLP